MFEKEICEQVRDHIGIEKQQVASNKRFLEACESEDVPQELREAIQTSINKQEELLTTGQRVLETMLKEKEE